MLFGFVPYSYTKIDFANRLAKWHRRKPIGWVQSRPDGRLGNRARNILSPSSSSISFLVIFARYHSSLTKYVLKFIGLKSVRFTMRVWELNLFRVIDSVEGMIGNARYDSGQVFFYEPSCFSQRRKSCKRMDNSTRRTGNCQINWARSITV